MTNKHMRLNDRIKIQRGLDRGDSFKKIAKDTGKDCTTISREVRKHLVIERKGGNGRRFNDCANLAKCKMMNESCTVSLCNRNSCRNCKVFCMTMCNEYRKLVCSKLEKAPYVCNGCKNSSQCRLEKRFYEATSAQDGYDTLLRECRSGFDIDEERATELGNILKEGTDRGHSVYHIIKSVGGEAIGYSPKTIYTYIDAGLFDEVRNIDLPRKVRYKPRKKTVFEPMKKDKTCRIGRTWEDFNRLRSEDPDIPVVEMDTVEGKKGIEEKVLLTLHFTNCRFMLAFIRERNTAESVANIFSHLRSVLGEEDFKKLFPVILTDNGSEFSDPKSIEEDKASGEVQVRLFYCDPRQSQQKGACENNHSMIRRIIPKGKSMNSYTQEDIDLVMSNINSYLRPGLGGKSPYELFSFMYGTNILDKLNIRKIPPTEVCLTPKLLGK